MDEQQNEPRVTAASGAHIRAMTAACDSQHTPGSREEIVLVNFTSQLSCRGRLLGHNTHGYSAVEACNIYSPVTSRTLPQGI